jgi:hypothetical protein
MATFDELAEEYAARIRKAVRRDHIAIAARMIKTAADLPRTNLAAEMGEIAGEINGLVYSSTKAALSETDKAAIAERVGKKLKLKRPEIVWMVTKGASVQNFLAVLTEIETIINEADLDDE